MPGTRTTGTYGSGAVERVVGCSNRRLTSSASSDTAGRLGHQESLGIVAPERDQFVPDLDGLDAFRHDLQPESVGERDHRLDDVPIRRCRGAARRTSERSILTRSILMSRSVANEE